ncbi:MAG: hypothetical protein LBU90_10020 [Bacteroidales bacterium]|jgi:hypothetical protein|nr:hypothetical protein [Bacteroidales bacterium]
MKKFLSLVIGVALAASASAQLSDRLFYQAGGTIGLDFSQLTGKVGHRNTPVVHKQVNYATIGFGARLNVFEFSNTFSMGLAAQPLVSIGRAYNKSTGGGVNFMFRTPFTFDVNIGNAATSKAHSRHGVVLGAGMQWIKYPFFGGDIPIFKSTVSGGQPYFINMNTNWWEPVAHIGIRSNSKHFFSNEVNVRVSYKTRSSLNLNGATNTSDNAYIHDFQRFSIMLSYLQFLNF